MNDYNLNIRLRKFPIILKIIEFNRLIFIFLLLNFQFVSNAQTNYTEEAGTLESIYEARARTVLNSFLRPHEYTLVVSAEMVSDNKKIQEYRDKIELQYLPGLPVPGDAGLQPANNSLHELKTKVSVDLIITPDVSIEKEKIIKQILINKLHLDESSGDGVTISRAPFPKDLIPEAAPPSILPDFTWKTWALVILLALIALAGVIYYVSRKGQTKKELDQTKELSLAANEDDNLLKDSVTEKNQKESLNEEEFFDQADIERARDPILSLVSQYPQICSKITASLIDKGKEQLVITVFEDMGWDLAKKMFTEIAPRAWGRLGQKLRSRKDGPKSSEVMNALLDFYKELISGVLESGALFDENNPFSFLLKATKSEREQILKDESPANIAIISFFVSSDEMSEILNELSVETQSQVAMVMTRLESLPDSIIKKLAQKIQTKLITFRKEPTNIIDGVRMAGRTLRSMSPEKESEIFQKMKESNPAEAEKIRRLYLQFEDLYLMPKSILSIVAAELEVEAAVAALKGMGTKYIEDFLSVLPPKRANMIIRDIESPAIEVSSSDCWSNRRNIILKLENILEQQGTSVKDIWELIDKEIETNPGKRSA